MALTDKLTAIGNAIRSKTGATNLMTLSQMPELINGIETGGRGFPNGTEWTKTTGNINSGNGYIIITMINELPMRKNSNYYKDSYYQEHFDFNKLL